MESDCADSEDDVQCPEGWSPFGEPTTDGCERKERWCWGSSCDRYKTNCYKQEWWICDTGKKCGVAFDSCVDEVTVTSDNVETVTSGTCSGDRVMSEGECEAYANMVGKPFELRAKNHAKGCYEKTVHGVDYVLFQKSEPRGDVVGCTSDAPCVCFEAASNSDGGAALSEQDLSTAETIADVKTSADSISRYLLLFSAGALLGAWHFTRAKRDEERTPLLEEV